MVIEEMLLGRAYSHMGRRICFRCMKTTIQRSQTDIVMRDGGRGEGQAPPLRKTRRAWAKTEGFCCGGAGGDKPRPYGRPEEPGPRQRVSVVEGRAGTSPAPTEDQKSLGQDRGFLLWRGGRGQAPPLRKTEARRRVEGRAGTSPPGLVSARPSAM